MFHLPSEKRRIILVDTTLRDGEQTPEVQFSPKGRQDILQGLVEAKVDEIEAGIPAMGQSQKNFVRTAADICRRSGVKTIAWCRGVPEDIQAAADCGTDVVHISLPVSDLHLEIMERDRRWVIEQLERCAAAARTDFDRFYFGAMDATRASGQFLRELALAAADMGYSRFRLADTVGIADPLSVFRLISSLSGLGIELEFHAHNDLAMATGNAITALGAGADAVSVTVNGLGERAGNAGLEAVAAAVHVSRELETGVNLPALQELSSLVAFESGIPVPSHAPITGEKIFTHESGIHCAGLAKSPVSFQPFVPEFVGRDHTEYQAGLFSGSSTICMIFSAAGIQLSRDDARELLPLLRDRSEELGRSLHPSELIELYQEQEQHHGEYRKKLAL